MKISTQKNKAKAFKILRSRVYEAEKRKKDQERSSNRRSQIDLEIGQRELELTIFLKEE